MFDVLGSGFRDRYGRFRFDLCGVFLKLGRGRLAANFLGRGSGQGRGACRTAFHPLGDAGPAGLVLGFRVNLRHRCDDLFGGAFFGRFFCGDLLRDRLMQLQLRRIQRAGNVELIAEILGFDAGRRVLERRERGHRLALGLVLEIVVLTGRRRARLCHGRANPL